MVYDRLFHSLHTGITFVKKIPKNDKNSPKMVDWFIELIYYFLTTSRFIILWFIHITSSLYLYFQIYTVLYFYDRRFICFPHQNWNI